MNNKQAFTLIELLVVVLIIGILAAVALPKYEQAVLKSRMMQVLPYLKAVKNAEEAYYLANGEYTNDMDSLAVDGTAPNGWTFYLMPDNLAKVEAHYQNRGAWYIITSFDHRTDWPEGAGITYCYAHSGGQYVKLCKSLGSSIPSSDNHTRTRIYE
ncbi:type IV pilin protein [Candidatus Avelusimicrobium caledoniensis]|uniref:type IV pilin protein n=1 Tax=Candidatus Avelusimicrobium caledoniensis TaxID=3416220 RepID=UPI003D0FE78A